MVKKRKIYLYAPGLNVGGGTERVFVDLANELNKSWTVIVLVNSVGNKALYKLNPDIPVKVFVFDRIKASNPDRLVNKVINRLGRDFFLRRFLKTCEIGSEDVLISFSAGITNECFKTHLINNLISFEHWPFASYAKYPKVQNMIRRNYPLLKSVVVLSEHERDVYDRLGCKTTKIPNALTFLPSDLADLKNNVVLSIGHINSQKRRDLLVNAWKLVSQKHPNWQLHIVGDGPLLEEVKSLISDLDVQSSIKIFPPTRNILSHYLQSSIFVLSSEFEALPLVLLEAKVMGLPCVSFDIIAGPNEIIQDNKDGFLVKFADTQGMADKINILIEDESLRKEFGKIANADAVVKFHPDIVFSTWNKFLTNLN